MSGLRERVRSETVPLRKYLRLNGERLSNEEAAARILVAMPEDVSLLIRHILENEGFATLLSTSLRDLRDVIATSEIDLVVLDAAAVNVRDGRRPHVRNWTLDQGGPPLLLVHRGQEPQRLSNLRRTGRVEILRAPLSAGHLISAIESLLRTKAIDRRTHLSFQDVLVDLETYRVYRNQRKVRLGPIEFRLLCHLINCAPRVVSRDELIAVGWPKHVFVHMRTVDVHVGWLRRALNKGNEPNLIRTVRSAGYALDSEN
jgi:two-component system, OmpR family, phosphate regulon response regulator PhoB